MQGFIVRVTSNNYEVYSEGKIYPCVARGKIKKDVEKLLVGDNVIISKQNEDSRYVIDKLLPRDNFLIRPKVSNIDQVIVIASLVDPYVSPKLINRFMVMLAMANIKPILCVSKCDREDFPWDEYHHLENMYKQLGYEVIYYSAKTKENIDKINKLLINRKTIFTGQTGVGKSKLINALIGKERQSEGETSKALGRGRHTTRIVEYIELQENTWIGDTPGFSSIDFEIIRISKEDLSNSFPGFEKYFANCKFRGCLHDSEPGCKVREALEKGEILEEHYQTYLEILHEIQNRKERY